MEASSVNINTQPQYEDNEDNVQNEIHQLTDFQQETLQYNFKIINIMIYHLNKDLNQMIESLSKRKKFPDNTISFSKVIEDIDLKNYTKTITNNNDNIVETKKKLYSIVMNVLNYLNIGEEYEPALRSNYNYSGGDFKNDPILYTSEQLKMIELLIHDKIIVEDWYKNDLNL